MEIIITTSTIIQVVESVFCSRVSGLVLVFEKMVLEGANVEAKESTIVEDKVVFNFGDDL